SPSSASTHPFCVSTSDFRPPPGRRWRPVGAPLLSSSSRPARIVSRANPVALATTASPPYPTLRDSAAAHSRRARSSSTAWSAEYFRRMTASISRSRFTNMVDDHHYVQVAPRECGRSRILRKLATLFFYSPLDPVVARLRYQA